jgi:hypothetical protein
MISIILLLLLLHLYGLGRAFLRTEPASLAIGIVRHRETFSILLYTSFRADLDTQPAFRAFVM